MTDKQKQAIKILNSLWNGGLKEEDYFLLMDFVIDTHDQSPQVAPWTWITGSIDKNYEPTTQGNSVISQLD